LPEGKALIMAIEITAHELFPRHVFSINLKEKIDSSLILSYLKSLTEDDWLDYDEGNGLQNSNEASSTKDLSILNNFLNLSQVITQLASSVGINYYNHEFGELSIIGSWGTRVKKAQHVGSHIHTNAYLCGCVYFEDNSSPITFLDEQYSKLFSIFPPNKKNKKDSCSYSTCSFRADEGTILIWPSSMRHRVQSNNSDKTRYSIAFNIAPKGLLDNNLGSKLYINENK
jgi:uncharacterized protein (TIGR02466 family)